MISVNPIMRFNPNLAKIGGIQGQGILRVMRLRANSSLVPSCFEISSTETEGNYE